MDEINERIQNAYVNSVLGEMKKLSVPEKHQLAIAKKTLKMSDAGANIMGGMNKKEAVDFLKKIGYSDKQIKKMSEETIEEAYKVAQNPSDKLWYALGSVGKYWMPVSSGYKSKTQAEAYSKKQPMANKAAKKLMPEDTELNEASEVEFKDFDSDKQKFITSIVGKGRVKNQQYFSGVHGTIIYLKGQMTDTLRVDKSELKKIASNKDVRWVDLQAIGMGYNKNET